MTLTLLILTGQIAYYSAAHDMAAIAAYRNLTIPAGSYGIAALEQEWLGWWGTLEAAGYTWPVVVVDYTHPDHKALVQARGIIAEVGWDHAGLIPGLRYDGRVAGRLTLWPPETAPGGRAWQ